MYIHPNTLQHMLPGEPTAEALFREQYYAEKHDDAVDETLIDPDQRQRSMLIRAQNIIGVGRFFA